MRTILTWPLLTLVACGGSYDFSDAAWDTGTDWSTTPPSTDTTPTAPPEVESDLLLLPAQTDVYVFVANPARDTVTRVNVRTYQVDTTPVGNDPYIVQTTPDFQTAVVFNRGDDSVTLIDANTLDKRTVPVRPNFNAQVLSPDGAFAVLWHDKTRERPDDPPAEGLQSFNEASFVDLRSGEHYPMAVGFNPRMVRFTPDGALAVVVADSYLALVDLRATPLVPKLIELTPGVLDPPTAEEVIVARDGSFAWVRQFGATELLVVDLSTGAISPIAGGDNPTDLDLSPDGTEAVAVARGSHEVWIYDAQQPTAPPKVLGLPIDSDYGSLLLDPTGQRGVLFTTATLTERYAVWDRLTDTVAERNLVKPVSSMAVTPTGESLMVFHTKADGPDTEALFRGQWALTLVSLDDFRNNPMLLPAEPLGFANSTTGDLGYFAMYGQPYFEVLDYHTLLHEQYELRSLPSYLGVLPDLAPEDGDEPPAWVSQEHELGRISFFDPDGSTLETLTGFELNAGIED